MASARTSVALALLLMSFWPSWLLLLPSAAGRRTITCLPGFHGPLPVEMETGYVTVGESDAGNMFYYFIKSERNPAEDPVLVWLAGGPGCSGLSAMVYEIGPLTFDVKANNSGGLPTLVYRSESWTKVCSIIFLDSPLGTGFSYATIETYEVGDLKTSKEVYTFIRKWFGDHPEFISNPLYIGGDSYSGMTVPVVAQQVSNGIQARLEPLLNLKGYLVGNPSTDLKFDGGSFIPYAHGMGLISDELYEVLRGINTVHILEPSCTFAASKPEPRGMQGRRFLDEHAKNLDAERRHLSEQARNLHLRLSSSEKCRTDAYVLSITWANDESVRETLGIHKGSVGNWLRCRNFLDNYEVNIVTVVPYHLNVTSGGYRALVYSGDHDMFVPFVGTQEWIRSLNYSIVDDWRSWWVGGNVAGFTRTYSNNLTFATVKGGGHTAPEYRPMECLAMLDRWMSRRPL